MASYQYRDFFNDGFGFVCRSCEREFREDQTIPADKHSRIMREGEAESMQPNLSNRALAMWLDSTQTTLVCPNCGIREKIG